MSIEKAQKILNSVSIPERHSYFQLKYFNIGKEYTIQGKLWQCFREIKVRKNNLEALNLEQEETQDKIQLLYIDLAKIDLALNACQEGTLDNQELTIRKRQANRRLTALNKAIEDLGNRIKWQTEEMNFFIQEFEGLNKIEPMRPLDDFESQRQYWNEKIESQIALNSLIKHPLNIDLVQTCLALPDDTIVKNKMLEALKNG